MDLRQVPGHRLKAIEIVFLLPCGKKQQRQFKTEEEAAEYLKVTHASESPLSFRYADDLIVTQETLDRIYHRVIN